MLPSGPVSVGGNPESIPANAWSDEAWASISQAEYDFKARPDGAWTAPNRAQGLRLTTRGSVARVTPRTEGDAPWVLSLGLRGVGREGRMTGVPPGAVRAAGNRIEHRRDSLGLTEWYVNLRTGIEQGFTLDRRPAAADTASPLVLDLFYEGGLEARQEEAGGAVLFSLPSPGAVHRTDILRYADLAVADADGKPVVAALDLAPGSLRITIQDEGHPYPLIVDPTIVVPAWTGRGDQFEELFGASVAGAGDVNGDGYDDLIVGAPRFDGGFFDEGRAFLFLGSPTGPSAVPAWTMSGDQTGCRYGGAVASAGDVNNDGYADVIVGAPNYDFVQVDEGRAFVYLGSAGGLGTVPVWMAEPDQNLAAFGAAVASAGDLNGDGYDDVIVGAPLFDSPFNTDEGAAFVYLGSASGPSPSPAWVEGSGLFNSAFGTSVASAGDVNRDGFDDVIVGAPLFDNAGFSDQGRAYVYQGSATGLSPNPAWTADGSKTLARFGSSVASAGDVNYDGYDDVIIGAPIYDSGRAFIYHGSATGLSLTPNWNNKINLSPAEYGASVAGVGDLDGDGFDDVVVGAPKVDDHTTTSVGLIRAFYGGAMGAGNTAAFSAQETQAGALLGGAVARAGDVNGDGLGDIIAGATGLDNPDLQVSLAGAAHLYLGFRTTPCVPAPELCNRRDDDCDGVVDDNLGTTTCGTGTCSRTVDNCVDGFPQTCTPGAPGTETCNGLDDDCDGTTDEGFDVDGDGFTTCAGDCNDGVASIHPGAPEVCNGLDDNCNQVIDEGGPDSDGDGIPDCLDPDDDNDRVPDGTDCAPLVNSVSAVPGEVGQTVRAVPGPPQGSYTWTPIVQANVHNVYRSVWDRRSGNWNDTLGCLYSEAIGNRFSETANPPAGSAFYYVITGVNRCGEGPAGFSSTGQPRLIPIQCVHLGLDTDGDTIQDWDDDCPLVSNASQADADLDGRGDACDNCAATANAGQVDADTNGIGDVCQDLDHDGYLATVDCNDNDPMVHPDATETCNARDDNCDGATDENLGTTTCGVGVCTRTVNNCVGGVSQTCTPGTPTAEVCNNLDDDCDGSVDEGTTTCGVGACTRTVNRCAGGVPQTCTPGTPTAETCNGIDDDCDGATDENLGTTTCGVGACTRTVNNCVGGVIQTCTPGAPTAETCNGIDDDCDGATDENLGTTTCGVGACTRTVNNCVGGVSQTCAPGAPTAETCNGIDDDCDGATDENLGTTTCGVGACTRTVNNCVGGVSQTCTPGTPAADDETCNGIDEDCDGSVDEDYASVETTCGVGACAATGLTSCVNGSVEDSCVPGTPTEEICSDAIDNDCDGEIDEGCPISVGGDVTRAGFSPQRSEPTPSFRSKDPARPADGRSTTRNPSWMMLSAEG
ncbi:MAG TPA: MopE-related protein [Candidatus Polarisedimenticolia bacterium]|nr:MopE-related protein [Candidatus Polarisedimenticolia bacterium]